MIIDKITKKKAQEYYDNLLRCANHIPPHKISREDLSLERAFERDAEKLFPFIYVPPYGVCTSTEPMVSGMFGYCNGIVLVDNYRMSMSSIHSLPEDCLDGMIGRHFSKAFEDLKIPKNERASRLCALVLPSKEDAKKIITSICASEGIKDITYAPGEFYEMVDGEKRVLHKHIIAIPSRGHVRVYTPEKIHRYFF